MRRCTDDFDLGSAIMAAVVTGCGCQCTFKITLVLLSESTALNPWASTAAQSAHVAQECHSRQMASSRGCNAAEEH